jgi:hypothetical protein
VITQLWEWGVIRETRSRPVGVCMTEHAAIEALSKALIAAGPSSTGQVAQVTLVRPVQAEPTYVREAPQRTAVYDGSVIRWR